MSTKNVRLYHFLLSHTLPWYAFGLRARDQKNLCFVVVVFLVAIKRLSLSPPSFLSVWDRYCCVVSGEINLLKIFKQEIQHLLVGPLDVFENLDRDTVTGFEQICQPHQEKATEPRAAAQQHLHALKHCSKYLLLMCQYLLD